jgi:uncharacterized protein (DUF697 family)
MTRKQLPKAIRRTDADLRVVSAGADVEAPARHNGTPHEFAEAQPEVWAESPVPANDPLPAVSSISQPLAERRLREAFKIVERHKMYAGLGGLFPMPAVNVVAVTAIILRMVKSLSDLYGVSFERDKTRSIIFGLMGGAAPTGLGAATTSTLAVVVPGAAAVGIAVASIAAASLTRRIGTSFIERFEREAIG